MIACSGAAGLPVHKPPSTETIAANKSALDTAAPLGDALDIPALPADTSSLFEPLAIAKRVPAKPAKDKPLVIKTGDDYALGRRQTARPEQDVEQIIPRSLSQAQVATVVQGHMADIRNCWDLVPKLQRADACTAQLALSISDGGAVTAIELGGDVPGGAQQCMTSAISKWTFPAAETRSDVEYGF